MKNLGYSLIALQGRLLKALNDQLIYDTFWSVMNETIAPKTEVQENLVSLVKREIEKKPKIVNQFSRVKHYDFTGDYTMGNIVASIVFLLQYWDKSEKETPYFSPDAGYPAGIIYSRWIDDPQGITYIFGTSIKGWWGETHYSGLRGKATVLRELTQGVTITSLDTRTNETTVTLSKQQFMSLRAYMAEPAPKTNSLPALADHSFQYRSTVIELEDYVVFQWRNGVWIYNEKAETLTYHGNLNGLTHTPNTANEQPFAEAYIELLSNQQRELLNDFVTYKYPEKAGERWYRI